MRPPSPRAIAGTAALSLCFGLAFIALFDGFSSSFPLRAAQGIAVFVCGAVIIGGPFVWLAVRMGNWSTPESEAEFEAVVRRSERLARDDLAAEPDETDFMALDPFDDDEFEELVRDALDDLPDWARRALDRVPVVISDRGRREGAYGLYQGDGVARDDYPDRIIIFRDTLRRDFGHDPDELRDQVVRTVRHELAHHLGFDELGVRGLGL